MSSVGQSFRSSVLGEVEPLRGRWHLSMVSLEEDQELRWANGGLCGPVSRVEGIKRLLETERVMPDFCKSSS